MPVLSVKLSRDIFRRLEQHLKPRGVSPEEFTAALLRIVVRRFESDPLQQLAGIIEAGPEDLCARHDDYIGRSIKGE